MLHVGLSKLKSYYTQSGEGYILVSDLERQRIDCYREHLDTEDLENSHSHDWGWW